MNIYLGVNFVRGREILSKISHGKSNSNHVPMVLINFPVVYWSIEDFELVMLIGDVRSLIVAYLRLNRLLSIEIS